MQAELAERGIRLVITVEGDQVRSSVEPKRKKKED
jgi:hypothetical protein